MAYRTVAQSHLNNHVYALIKALLRHYADLEFHHVHIVCEFMCTNYNY